MKILIVSMVLYSQSCFLIEDKPMEIAMGLTGIVGAAFFMAPSSPLPSDTDYKKAKDRLQEAPDDPEANTVVGKYLCFVQGDYENGLQFLSKSGDKTLQTLAQHELAPLYADTGPKKIGMGDEWISAAKTQKPLFRIFYDRAAYWYGSAWQEMKNQPLWGDKIRERLQKIYTVVPGVSPSKNLVLPTGWKSPYAETKAGRSQAASRSGGYSFQITGWKSPLPSYTAVGQTIDVKPGVYKISAWAITDGTDQDDGFLLSIQNAAGNNLVLKPVMVPKDQPWWRKFTAEVEVPPEGSRIALAFNVNSKQGTTFLDDWSVKGVDGKELLKNPSFEDR